MELHAIGFDLGKTVFHLDCSVRTRVALLR